MFLSSHYIILKLYYKHLFFSISGFRLLAMPVCFFNLVTNSEYSYVLIAAAFYNKSLSSKTSLLVKNLSLPTFHDDKAEILAVGNLNRMEPCFA